MKFKNTFIENEPNDFFIWDEDLDSQSSFVAKLNAITKNELLDCLNEIDEKVDSKQSVFEEIKDLCFQLICRIPVYLVKINEPKIIRCRPNGSKKPFKKISELSYNPKVEEIKYGRFNLKKEPLFYAILPTKAENNFPPEMAAMFESCKYLLDDNNILTESQYLTISYWNVIKPFYAVSLLYNQEAASKNQTVRNINSDLSNSLTNKFTPESKEIISLMYRYFSEKAGQINNNDNNYIITIAFRHALEKYYSTNIKAILYSSAATENNCVNIVINRETIDNKDIEYKSSIMYIISQNKNIDPYSEFAILNNEGFLEFYIPK